MFNSSNTVDDSTIGELIGNKSTMNLKIHLENHYKSKIYTSSSPARGYLQVESTKDVRFNKVQILLLGTSTTHTNNVHAPNKTSHTFLKLEMPILSSAHPSPRVYQAGQTYIVPFNFVIPSYLTLNACDHNIHTDAVRESHLFPPPSMGNWFGKDDCSPDMARVDYSVVARVFLAKPEDGKRGKVYATTQSIRVLPAFPEHAPLHITKHDRLFKMSRCKTLRKSLLTGKTGTITVSARQPGAIMLSADGASAASTNAQLDLIFEPTSSQVTPPTVTGITAKIMAITYYSSGAISHFPNMGDWIRAFGADSRGTYPSTVALSTPPLQQTTWQQQVRGQERRDSGYSSDLNVDSEGSGQGSEGNRRRGSNTKDSTAPVLYSTSIQVPIELPVHKKMFIPSFHSCILSRAYVLWLSVSLSSGGTTSSLTLTVPLQIGVNGTQTSVDPTGLPSFATAIEEAEEAEADAYLNPRTLSVSDVPLEQHVLPGYADLMADRVTAAR